MKLAFLKELLAELMTYLREIGGEFEITDMPGLIAFIRKHGEEYPKLLELVDINEDAIVEHFH